VTLEIETRDSVTGATQVQRDAFHETFSELKTSVETAHSEGRGVETTKMIVDALRPLTEKLGLRTGATSTGPEPRDQLPFAILGICFFLYCTAHGIIVEYKPESHSGNHDARPVLPLSRLLPFSRRAVIPS
jgi:hypothetical protein